MVYEDETKPRNPFMQTMEQGRGHLKRYINGGHPSWRRDRNRDFFPNASKTMLLVKSEHYERALQIFPGSGVNVTTDATKYSGGYVGPREVCHQLTRRKVGTLITHLEKLNELAKAEPHASYSYFFSSF